MRVMTKAYTKQPTMTSACQTRAKTSQRFMPRCWASGALSRSPAARMRPYPAYCTTRQTTKTTAAARRKLRSEGRRVGPQPARADPGPHHLLPDPHPPDLQVRQEPPVGAVLGVAHVVSVLRALTADCASLCHV